MSAWVATHRQAPRVDYWNDRTCPQDRIHLPSSRLWHQGLPRRGIISWNLCDRRFHRRAITNLQCNLSERHCEPKFCRVQIYGWDYREILKRSPTRRLPREHRIDKNVLRVNFKRNRRCKYRCRDRCKEASNLTDPCSVWPKVPFWIITIA